uniref:Precorrin-3B C17-methyltransferase n=1 Tax=Candidatus Kentrum sp. UNK TaxID=2126344 RepID=A0A451AU60_9GAMM|nr:MAG: precorrin-3B C17-methyltransferase [Candidatus Kentron sp. UNK]VFK69575.1 MAG: precorrin-3B C17-methyltransferase [Candidatus Kentron sp. UNK]
MISRYGKNKDSEKSSARTKAYPLSTLARSANLFSGKIILGLGCDRGTSLETLEAAIDQALLRAGETRAALVGAPLSHDFCAISLSDLLTPWQVIARRLDAAGRGDFVVALYNPKSHRRTQQIVEAQEILLRYRRSDTPVAIVERAYRARQDAQITTLDRMLECAIGMSSTVLVGNSGTYLREGLMITPRGYGDKYDY